MSERHQQNISCKQWKVHYSEAEDPEVDRGGMQTYIVCDCVWLCVRACVCLSCYCQNEIDTASFCRQTIVEASWTNYKKQQQRRTGSVCQLVCLYRCRPVYCKTLAHLRRYLALHSHRMRFHVSWIKRMHMDKRASISSQRQDKLEGEERLRKVTVVQSSVCTGLLLIEGLQSQEM